MPRVNPITTEVGEVVTTDLSRRNAAKVNGAGLVFIGGEFWDYAVDEVCGGGTGLASCLYGNNGWVA